MSSQSEYKSVIDCALDDDRLEELRAMRRRIAQTLDDLNTPPRDLSSLASRQLEIGREIDSLIAARMEDESSVVDESDDEAWDDSAI